ncbi:hypothetical protein SEA_ESTES_63 [Mycobacterium phage Estes]|uniref:Uncharacterized protein n=1 Tax=Mycobacterium phage Estes TaxID=2759459 RepID=A0A7G9A2D3_9CAUD|nr:hypothetical protein J4U03_gp063 [Mycobacterium phage Estes]QNL30772.1 hypothetical protein SEA_ESTES_63 [Mycobacterium phage Estes]
MSDGEKACAIDPAWAARQDEGIRMEVLRQSVRALDPTVEPEDFIEFMDDIATWVKTGEVS